jgi:hypothetical protein
VPDREPPFFKKKSRVFLNLRRSFTGKNTT